MGSHQHRNLLLCVHTTCKPWHEGGDCGTPSRLRPIGFCQQFAALRGRHHFRYHKCRGLFHPTNQFQVLLSDASGSFANPSIVGTLNGSSGGVIQMVIPSGLPFGNGYMLAVQSTEPATTLKIWEES